MNSYMKVLALLCLCLSGWIWAGCAAKAGPSSPANPTSTSTPTASPTATGTPTRTVTPANTATATASASPSSTHSPTPTGTRTSTATVTPTATPTSSSTATRTPTATSTPLYGTAVTMITGFAGPIGIRYDGNGHLWVSDKTGNALSQWTTAGAAVTNITTFNGSQTFNSPYGLGLDPATGDVYVANVFGNNILAFHPTGAYLGSAPVSMNVLGVGVNSAGTTFYMVGTGIGTSVFAYSISGSTFSFAATFGSSNLSGPYGAALDSSDNLYVADYSSSRIVEFNTATDTYVRAVTLANLGSAGGPSDLALDGSGNIFTADQNNQVIQEFDSGGNYVGSYGSGKLFGPVGITLDPSENIYVVDYNGKNVVKLVR